MTTPRPFHRLHREIRTDPDESEPIHSYEEPSILLGGKDEDEFEEDFHQRFASNAKSRHGSAQGSHSGGSFWRAASETDQQRSNERPAFSSMAIRGKDSAVDRKGKKSGLLGGIMKSQEITGKSRELADAQSRNSWSGSSPSDSFGRSDSASSPSVDLSRENVSSKKKREKSASKARAADRRGKFFAQTSDLDADHVDNEGAEEGVLPPISFASLRQGSSLERSSSDQSTGSLLYGKTPHSGNLLGKSGSLIFPSTVDSSADADSESDKLKRTKVNLMLDHCDTIRFSFRKKLILSNLGLVAADLPVKEIVGMPLGNVLYKLAMSGNRLGSIPPKLVTGLPALKHLDISQCELHQLPDKWNLPQLKRLNVSHNGLRDFPEEGVLEGLPELQELNMYGNKVAEVIIPNKSKILAKLETLNLGFNDLAYLPDDLDRLKALRTLKVMNNFLEKVPMRVCEMELKSIDVSSNPVIQPPQETCDRGICSMRRYYHCLRMEEQIKPRALEEVHKKTQKGKKQQVSKKKTMYGSLLMKSLTKPVSRKSSDDSLSLTSSQVASIDLPLSPRSSQTEGSDKIPRIRTESNGTVVAMRPRVAEAGTSARVGTPPHPGRNPDQVTVNDTLKVIFVGMAMVGKTSMIRRLIGGENASIPTHDDRTVGVDIYEWDPKIDHRFEHIDSRINFQSQELSAACGDVDVKFSVWDFAGQHVYHATHELFFSNRALYVLVWDMGATNRATHRRNRKALPEEANSAFKLSYDSSDDESADGGGDSRARFAAEEARRADRALERDIDEKVQFWVDCIQSSAPGSAILPVASFADFFARDNGDAEAKRRCMILKNRLLKHEERRIQGIKQRLQEYMDQNRANDRTAVRLRKLLCDYTRPKLIFGNDASNSVVRVSGTQYTGFENLTEKIIGIASGRDKHQWRHPIFHGHIGARIPRMRLEVREAVRSMRDKFKVVEWGYFVNQLRDRNLLSVEDISDALHFLASIGELSYFGGVMPGKSEMASNPKQKEQQSFGQSDMIDPDSLDRMTDDETDDEMEDPDTAVLSMDGTSITVPSTDDGSQSLFDEHAGDSLSQFVFLNPRWLVAAVACILRHDLDREIKETRRLQASERGRDLKHGTSFYDAQLNCPVITAEDACLLWQAKRITKKAAERAQEHSNNMTMTPFEFLQLLLIRFGVFVPIDLSIEKAELGGTDYAQLVDKIGTNLSAETPETVLVAPDDDRSRARFFFLPSLLGDSEPTEAWTYKNNEAWKTTLCHSILFPDGVPPGLMERLTAGVLSSVYAVAKRGLNDTLGDGILPHQSKLTVKEVLCWRTAFLIKLGTQSPSSDGVIKESIVEVFGHIADKDSHLCVGSGSMGIGMRRLIISGRGPDGDDGRKIWKGGYLLVAKCVQRAMDQYGGVEYEKEAFCPECLAKKTVSEACFWPINVIRSAVIDSDGSLRCKDGHSVRTALVAGPTDNPAPERTRRESTLLLNPSAANEAGVPVQDLLRAVVVVGLWDDKAQKVVRVGSGFIVDPKRGLIVTASHTLMNIWGDRNYPFGENYYGLRQGKAVIGVIPRPEESVEHSGRGRAVFRYFANIVAKDPEMEKGLCQLDACVLQITTRLENDVGGDGSTVGDQPERILMNNRSAMKRENLQSLRIRETCELEEQVRIVGYNQGGEGLLGPGESLNLDVDFAKGYICKKFTGGDQSGVTPAKHDRFKPREEVVAMCPTIGGHSGGPCVNQQGEVIGILSRADPADNQRCYISPTSEWKALVKAARRLG